MNREMANAIKHNLNMTAIQPPQITVTVIDGKYQYSGNKELIEIVSKALEAKEPEVVTIEYLINETYEYLPFEGYRGNFKDATDNVRNALSAISKRFKGKPIIIKDGE